jgi:hypothetical protein
MAKELESIYYFIINCKFMTDIDNTQHAADATTGAGIDPKLNKQNTIEGKESIILLIIFW